MTVFSPDSAQIDEGVLLRELHHRVNHGVAAAINLVSAAAVRAEGREAKSALSDVVELLHGHAELHRALARPQGKALIDASTNIRKLSCALRRSLLHRMNIRLAVAADSLPLQSERCWLLGLIVHELVTNASEHACFDARSGEIRIKLSRIGAVVNCVALDNGSAVGPGRLGTRTSHQQRTCQGAGRPDRARVWRGVHLGRPVVSAHRA